MLSTSTFAPFLRSRYIEDVSCEPWAVRAVGLSLKEGAGLRIADRRWRRPSEGRTAGDRGDLADILPRSGSPCASQPRTCFHPGPAVGNSIGFQISLVVLLMAAPSIS
jgi:hypothetical protein